MSGSGEMPTPEEIQALVTEPTQEKKVGIRETVRNLFRRPSLESIQADLAAEQDLIKRWEEELARWPGLQRDQYDGGLKAAQNRAEKLEKEITKRA